MLEMLMHDDTGLIRNDAVKPKPFIDVSRLNFMLLQTRKFSIKRQSANQNNEHIIPSTSCHIPRNLNYLVETNMNPISSRLTPHTLYPNTIVKLQ